MSEEPHLRKRLHQRLQLHQARQHCPKLHQSWPNWPFIITHHHTTLLQCGSIEIRKICKVLFWESKYLYNLQRPHLNVFHPLQLCSAYPSELSAPNCSLMIFAPRKQPVWALAPVCYATFQTLVVDGNFMLITEVPHIIRTYQNVQNHQTSDPFVMMWYVISDAIHMVQIVTTSSRLFPRLSIPNGATVLTHI